MTGLGNVRPSTGGRVSLKLQREQADAIVYTCALLYGETELAGGATIDVASGAVTLQGLDAAPEWLTTLTHLLARQAWRAAQTTPWPRRITRWRAQ